MNNPTCSHGCPTGQRCNWCKPHDMTGPLASVESVVNSALCSHGRPSGQRCYWCESHDTGVATQNDTDVALISWTGHTYRMGETLHLPGYELDFVAVSPETQHSAEMRQGGSTIVRSLYGLPTDVEITVHPVDSRFDDGHCANCDSTDDVTGTYCARCWVEMA